MKISLSVVLLTLMCLAGLAQSATYEKTVISSSTWSENPVIATSTQQNGIAIYENYVYMAYYNTDRNLCISRNNNYGVGTWVTVVLPHVYEQRELNNGDIVYDNHNTPNIAISPNDKRIHLAFDMHAGDLRYIISEENAAITSDANFTSGLFSSTRNYLQSNQRKLTSITYPRFFVGADDKLFIMYRVGGSGSGDAFFGEYKDDGYWFSPGKLISRDGDYNGSTTRCAYFNEVQYVDGRIYLTWVWRESPAASDNHDLMFAYSEDNGQTWKNSEGASLSIPMSLNSPGIKVATIPTGSGLTNHNGCTVDGNGNVHVTHRISGAYQHYVGIRDGESFNWSNSTITTFAGDRSKVYADAKTNDLYFLVRHGSSLKMFTTASNGELWNQWTQKSEISDSFITSGNSIMNAAGDMLTTMAVSSDDRLQIIRWSLSTNSPNIDSETVETDSPSLSWAFDTDGDPEGWSAGSSPNNGDNAISVSNGVLKMTWNTATVPTMYLDPVNVETGDYPKILLRFKNNTAVTYSTGTCPRIVPNTTEFGNKFYNLVDHTASDTEFHTYIETLESATKYGGTLNALQIQGLRNTTGSDYSIEFAEIRLIGPDNTWTGAVSTKWNVAGNWSNNAVPTGEIVTIPLVANQPTISSADAIVADLNLEDGVIVTVSGGQTLTVLSNVIAPGTGFITVGSGSSLVTYGTVEGTSHVFGRTTTYDSNTGKYSVVGSPVSGASTSSLGSRVYSYDESVAYGSDGSIRFVEVATPETMAIGEAYFSAFTGEVSFIGMPNTGNVEVSLSYNSGDGSNAGFNLVSNPYPSAIDFASFIRSENNPDIDGAIYLWDDGGSDNGHRTNADYITVNSVGTVSGGSGRSGDWNGAIASAQGFFVKASSAGTLNFNNEMKVVGSNTSASYFRTANEDAIQSLKLSLRNDEGVTNETLVGFASDATTGFDRMYDALKMDGNKGIRLFTKLEGQAMAIQGLPLSNETVIPLGISVDHAGIYTISLVRLKNWMYDQLIYLEDTKLNKRVALSTNNDYQFQSVATKGEIRFNLIVTNASNILGSEKIQDSKLAIEYTHDRLTLQALDSQLNKAHIDILDLSGAHLLQKELMNISNKTEVDFKFERQKLYIIRVTNNDNVYIAKVIFN